ncbi:MAG TPA: hypothetical protein VG916_01580 [Gemmatimonadaceae bacterium]|nr:hypothetical protein [Gemmatimonadaceae bacterium]
MRIPRTVAAIVGATIPFCAQAQAPSDSSGFWISAGSVSTSGSETSALGGYTWLSHGRLYSLHFLWAGHLNPRDYPHATVPAHAESGVVSVEYGRNFPHDNYAFRAQVGLGALAHSLVPESGGSSVRTTTETTVAATTTLGADWTFSKYVWVGAEFSAAASAKATLGRVGIVFGIGLRP